MTSCHQIWSRSSCGDCSDVCTITQSQTHKGTNTQTHKRTLNTHSRTIASDTQKPRMVTHTHTQHSTQYTDIQDHRHRHSTTLSTQGHSQKGSLDRLVCVFNAAPRGVVYFDWTSLDDLRQVMKCAMEAVRYNFIALKFAKRIQKRLCVQLDIRSLLVATITGGFSHIQRVKKSNHQVAELDSERNKKFVH